VVELTTQYEDTLSEMKKQYDMDTSSMSYELNQTTSAIMMDAKDVESSMKDKLNGKENGIKDDFNDRLINLSEAQSDIEKEIIESKALLKESNTYITNTTKGITEANNHIIKLEGEHKVLSGGECPYCHQLHVDKDKLKSLHDEMAAIELSVTELNTVFDEITSGINDLETRIDNDEVKLSVLKSERDEIDDEMKLEIGKVRVAFTKDAIVLNENTETSINEHTDITDKALTKYKDRYTTEVSGMDDALIIARDKCTDGINLREEHSDSDCHEIVSTIKHSAKRLSELQKEINPYTEQLEQCISDIIEYDETPLKGLIKKSDHYKILIKLLTDNKSFVRKNLLDQYVPFINGKIADYLIKIDLPHTITINNDLSVDIEYMNRSLGYGNLSNGESRRLQLAVGLAFRDLLSVSGHQFNFLGIDELLDNGIDPSGFLSINKLLKEIENVSMFVVSHRDELITEVDKTITVIKENGFTKIDGCDAIHHIKNPTQQVLDLHDFLYRL